MLCSSKLVLAHLMNKFKTNWSLPLYEQLSVKCFSVFPLCMKKTLFRKMSDITLVVSNMKWHIDVDSKHRQQVTISDLLQGEKKRLNNFVILLKLGAFVTALKGDAFGPMWSHGRCLFLPFPFQVYDSRPGVVEVTGFLCKVLHTIDVICESSCPADQQRSGDHIACICSSMRHTEI